MEKVVALTESLLGRVSKKKMEFSILGWVGGSKGGHFPSKKNAQNASNELKITLK